MPINTPDTTVSSEILDMLLSREGGIGAIICRKLVDSLVRDIMRMTCYLSKIELSKKLTHWIRKQLLFHKFSKFSGNKRWMVEIDSDPSSATIL